MDGATFAEHVSRITSSGYVCTLLDLGHELGLFELMMSQNTPMTSHQIADKAGMKERYVREWLAGMVTGQIVTYDPAARCYHIPEPHRDSLRGSASLAGGVAVIGSRKRDIKSCFMRDGPNGFLADDEPYWDWFGNWRKLTSQSYVENDLVPCLKQTDLFSKLDCGAHVLDACCGSGDITLHLAAMFPNSTFTGIDISDKALHQTTKHTQSSKLTNLAYKKADIGRLYTDSTKMYDIIFIFETLHDLPHPELTLKELDKVLNPGGVLVCTDFVASSRVQDDVGNLRISAHYAISLHHCVPSKLIVDPNKEREKTWDMADMEHALASVFHVSHSFELPGHIVMKICYKQ